MSDAKERLAIASEVADHQRRALRREWSETKDAVAPTALKDRASARVAERVTGTTDELGRFVRRYKVPLIGAGVVGFAVLLRKPIARGGRKVLPKAAPRRSTKPSRWLALAERALGERFRDARKAYAKERGIVVDGVEDVVDKITGLLRR